MVDAFSPLRPTLEARAILDAGYAQSWLEEDRA